MTLTAQQRTLLCTVSGFRNFQTRLPRRCWLEGALHITGVTHDAVAVGPTTLLFVPLMALDRLLDWQPRYWRHFGILMAFKVRLAFIALEDLSIVQPAERLARRLVWLAYCAVTGGQSGRCRTPSRPWALKARTSMRKSPMARWARWMATRSRL